MPDSSPPFTLSSIADSECAAHGINGYQMTSEFVIRAGDPPTAPRFAGYFERLSTARKPNSSADCGAAVGS
jgi:hypothetical protein